ncbi:hypothetical protein BKA70DRAFT_410219 [Coprinopsis sp. MPI-PUGE-AT-0042]|nr:hypothetical protein BKA70DRAFT_410219 [Coprinopsis sp. MPI-PUGE-AT-0042]
MLPTYADIKGHLYCSPCVAAITREGLIECAQCRLKFSRSPSSSHLCTRKVFLPSGIYATQRTAIPEPGSQSLRAEIARLTQALTDVRQERDMFAREARFKNQELQVAQRQLAHEKRARQAENDSFCWQRDSWQRESEIKTGEAQALRQELTQVRNDFSVWTAAHRDTQVRCQSLQAQSQKQEQEIERLRKDLEASRKQAVDLQAKPANPVSFSFSSADSSTAFQTPTKPRPANQVPPRQCATPEATPPRQVEEVFAQSSHAAQNVAGPRARVIRKLPALRPTARTRAPPAVEDTKPIVQPTVNINTIPGPKEQAPPSPPPSPPKPKPKKLYRGADIKWRGYGCPKKTGVPACTSKDGFHYFSGSGTNQYKRRFTCQNCGFWCSESW